VHRVAIKITESRKFASPDLPPATCFPTINTILDICPSGQMHLRRCSLAVTLKVVNDLKSSWKGLEQAQRRREGGANFRGAFVREWYGVRCPGLDFWGGPDLRGRRI